MSTMHYFYNCSQEYIDSIEKGLYQEINDVISALPKRDTQSEINNDLFWLLTLRGWSYDTLANISQQPPEGLKACNVNAINTLGKNNRSLCRTTSTLDATWHSDFAKFYDNRLVQIEAQFGKVESMFKDFCGFKIACFERRLALGIEIVLSEPNTYFAHRKSSVSGMAYFDIARKMLPAINLDCPIWLIGLNH